MSDFGHLPLHDHMSHQISGLSATFMQPHACQTNQHHQHQPTAFPQHAPVGHGTVTSLPLANLNTADSLPLPSHSVSRHIPALNRHVVSFEPLAPCLQALAVDDSKEKHRELDEPTVPPKFWWWK